MLDIHKLVVSTLQRELQLDIWKGMTSLRLPYHVLKARVSLAARCGCQACCKAQRRLWTLFPTKFQNSLGENEKILCTFAFPNEHISKKQKIPNGIHKPGNNLSLKQLRQSEDGVNRKTKSGVLQCWQLFTRRTWVTSGKKNTWELILRQEDDLFNTMQQSSWHQTMLSSSP